MPSSVYKLFLFIILLAPALAHAGGALIDPGLAPNPIFPPCAEPLRGVNAPALEKFLQDAETVESHSVIIVKNGCTVAERHYGGILNEFFSIQSVTKSVASLTIGILIEQGRLKLDDKIVNFFPSIQNDPQKSQITVRQLLTHTSGYGDWATISQTGSNLLERSLNSPLQSPPGTAFLYSSMTVHLLTYIIEAASGQPTDQYIQARIFDPLGIQSVRWVRDAPSGAVDTGGGLYMQTRDMLNIGAMMMNRGVWNNHRIISEDWWAQSVAPSNPYFSYGLLWWLYALNEDNIHYDIFSAVGHEGQYITVYPKEELMVVRTHRVGQGDDVNRIRHVYWYEMPERVKQLVAQP